MRRKVALISAAITTFSVVVLVSVVYAYQGLAAGPAAGQSGANQTPRTVQVADSTGQQSPSNSAAQPALSQPQGLSVQAAASIAAQFIHRTDLYSAQMSSYNGAPAFKISFSSGEVVYVSTSGVVLAVVPPPALSTMSQPQTGSGGHAFSSGGSYEHESESEHESGSSDDSGGGGD